VSNVVTLTFAGDTQKVEQSFDRVGQGARDMGRAVEASGDSFDRAAERSDTLDTRAMGFRDTLTGIQDGAQGVKRAAAGDWGFETLLLLGTGVGDLASGLTNFLIPALKATRIGQMLLNTAFLTSPLTWIIVGIVALVAIFVVLWVKFAGFRNFWIATWNVIKKAGSAAWDWIKGAASRSWDFLKKIPGWIASAFKGIANAILWPYKTAFNGIARAWNATVGQLSWSVPSWVPFIGGNSISVPNLPTFHSGGRVPGAPGQYVPILAMAGESVSATGGGGGGDQWIRVDLGELGDALLPAIARAVDRRGGRVTALGVKVVGGAIRT
jgi:phage-related protein